MDIIQDVFDKFLIYGKYKDKSPCEEYGIYIQTRQLFFQIRHDPHSKFVSISHHTLLNHIMKSIIYLYYFIYRKKKGRKLKTPNKRV